MKKIYSILGLLLITSFYHEVMAEKAPKYGPHATPLSKKTNLEYFQKNGAADFWALIPYYLPQPTGRACGAANLTLVMNGARSTLPMNFDDKLLSVTDFVKNYTDKNYETAVLTNKKFDRMNVTNKNMARLLEVAAEKLKIKTKNTRAQVFNVDVKNLAKSKEEFIKNLEENEKSSDDFIVISFIQQTLTGDPEAITAHVATIGAYDAKKKLVLIFDPDREWYEPYWSPVDQVFESVRDPRADGIQPGWIYFKVR